MSKAIVLVGLPATGKSTYVKEVLTKKMDFVIVSNDEVTSEWAERDGLTYNEAFEKYRWKDISDEVQRRTKEAVKDGRNIVFDNTHMTKKSRDRSLMEVPDSYKKIAIVFDIIKQERVRRATKRFLHGDGKFVPESSIKDMKNKYEEPLERDFDEIKRIGK